MRWRPLGSGRWAWPQPSPALTHVLCSKRMLRVVDSGPRFQYSNEYSAVPDHIVAVGDVDLGIVAAPLVRQGGIVDFPDAAAFDEVVVRVLPELDAVAEPHRSAVGRCELVAAADPGDVAVANDDMMRVPAAEPVRGTAGQREALVDDVSSALSLVHDMPLQCQLDARVNLGRVPLRDSCTCQVVAAVPVIARLLQVFPLAISSRRPTCRDRR